jgi:leucyl/phenylalanyl-tRNA--protein transferase
VSPGISPAYPRAVFPPDERIVEFFLEAYRHGAFPMAEPAPLATATATSRRRARRIDWFIPDPRAIVDLLAPPRAPQDLGGFHLPRSLARRLRAQPFVMTSDTAFEQVIRACAEPAPGREDTWLDDRLIHAYTRLHLHGIAHSVEAWLPPAPGDPVPTPVLVGGVYGVALGSTFSAESMFCRPNRGGTNASKFALAFLVRHLRQQGFTLLDVQLRNHHTDQFGVSEVPAREYLERLTAGLDRQLAWNALDVRWT